MLNDTDTDTDPGRHVDGETLEQRRARIAKETGDEGICICGPTRLAEVVGYVDGCPAHAPAQFAIRCSDGTWTRLKNVRTAEAAHGVARAWQGSPDHLPCRHEIWQMHRPNLYALAGEAVPS